MTPLPVEELLTPISPDQPCGADLAYAPEFVELELTAAGKPERQTGNVVIPAEPPQWPVVYEAALALARRTRDLRLAVLLARAGARLQGLVGYLAGLQLVDLLLKRCWDTVHPQLDTADGNDPTMRMNALASLCHPDSGLADLRSAGIITGGHVLTVRLIELGWTNATAMAGESRPTQEGLARGLRETANGDDAVFTRMRAVHETASSIERLFSQRVKTTGPDFPALLQITQALAKAAAEATGAAEASSDDFATTVAGTRAPATVPGAIRSREDVVRTLGVVCEWIERHEPSNPAPLLIRRAQRLMSMSFIDLVRDLAPDGLTQLERIAGVAES